MTPDYEKAATNAVETLIKHNITSSPISPLPILKNTPNVLAVNFSDIGFFLGKERRHMISMFGDHNQDAVTFVDIVNDKKHYIVTYNQQLPYALIQRSLARELAHIILGHDGSLPEEIRNEEARCFAHHLICPRPLIHLVQASNIRMTVEVLGNLTGCYDRCIASMRRLPAAHVPADLNRKLAEMFHKYFSNFFEFQRVLALDDGSALADIGSYMEGYEE